MLDLLLKRGRRRARHADAGRARAAVPQQLRASTRCRSSSSTCASTSVSQVVVQGSARFPWQEKSLKNLQRLLPALKLDIV